MIHILFILLCLITPVAGYTKSDCCDSVKVRFSVTGDTVLVFNGIYQNLQTSQAETYYAEYYVYSFTPTYDTLHIFQIPVSNYFCPTITLDSLNKFKTIYPAYNLDIRSDSSFKTEITQRNTRYEGRINLKKARWESSYTTKDGKVKRKRHKGNIKIDMYSCNYDLRIMHNNSILLEMKNLHTMYCSNSGESVNNDPDIFRLKAWENQTLGHVLLFAATGQKSIGTYVTNLNSDYQYILVKSKSE